MMNILKEIREMNIASYKTTLFLVFYVFVSIFWGCATCERVDAFARVKDIGPSIKTKYRYSINECRVEGCKRTEDSKRYSEYLTCHLKRSTLEFQPDVFTTNGIPINISQRSYLIPKGFWWLPGSESVAWLSIPLMYASFFSFPGVMSSSKTNAIEVEIARVGVRTPQVEWGYDKISTVGNIFIPLAFVPAAFWNDPPDTKGHEGEYVDWECVTDIGPNFRLDVGDRAQVYAIAALLKEMEDSGAIDAALAKIAEQKREADRLREAEEERLRLRQEAKKSIQMAKSGVAGKPPYRIIKLKREEGSDFAYSFELELMENASIQTFFGVQNVFANEVLVAYMMEYPNANSHTLRVSVHPRLEEGRIVGRAEVLTIAPVSLSYDAGTRRGRLSVRFNPGQAEEARAWVRKNIETLAQDKNIALTTGQLPPAATYYSLGERIEGSIMEIEFKTE